MLYGERAAYPIKFDGFSESTSYRQQNPCFSTTILTQNYLNIRTCEHIKETQKQNNLHV